MNIFEKASKEKLRFPTDIGNLSIEDLWDLPLQHANVCLDNIAKGINKKLKESEEESFVSVESTINEALNLKLDILKHIIKYKIEEIQRNSKEKETADKRNRILEIISKKKDEDLSSRSIEELEELLQYHKPVD